MTVLSPWDPDNWCDKCRRQLSEREWSDDDCFVPTDDEGNGYYLCAKCAGKEHRSFTVGTGLLPEAQRFAHENCRVTRPLPSFSLARYRSINRYATILRHRFTNYDELLRVTPVRYYDAIRSQIGALLAPAIAAATRGAN